MDFKALITRQRAYFQSGATRSAGFRRAGLASLAAALDSREPELLAALHTDLRKRAQDAYATEIGFVLNEIRHAQRHLPAWMKPARRRSPALAWPARTHVHPDPYGVALILGPWNYPLQLLLSPLVGAIAAGNCTVLKPSEFAPATTAVVSGLIRATFPEEYIAIVEGGSDTAGALLAEKFDTIFFTGSTETGRAVMAAAARHLTPVTLELGGKCPCIVCLDAPVETTARRILWGKFMNAGQTCVAPDHLWVDSRIAPALLAAMRDALAGFYGPDPRKSPHFGRIINQRHFDRLAAYLEDGTIFHGGDHDAADLYLAPTILTGVAADSPVMTEEIFGPILPVMEFTNLDTVLAGFIARPKPLAMYLFTSNRNTQHQVLAGSRSGGVCINDTILHILGNDLPFGGVGESGMGNYHGRASFDCFSHQRVVMRRPFGLDPRFRYPPASLPLDRFKRLLRFLG